MRNYTQEKRERFLKISQRRKLETIQKIKSLCKLSNKRVYEYDFKELKSILKEIGQELKNANEYIELQERIYERKKERKAKNE